MEKGKKVLTQKERRNKIKEILKINNSLTQSEIVEKLKSLGYNHSQGTINKDLKVLGIKKSKGSKNYDLSEDVKKAEIKKIADENNIKKDSVITVLTMIIQNNNIGQNYRIAAQVEETYPDFICDTQCTNKSVIIYYKKSDKGFSVFKDIRKIISEQIDDENN